MNLTSHRKDIDALRGLAISLGILYHLDLTIVSGGFVALDIFLVISGYLISAQIIKRLEVDGQFSFGHFYANRVRRLFPALFVFILFCTLFYGLFFIGNPKTTDHFISQVRYSLFALVNIFFKNNTQGYFEVSSDKMPLLNVWSLSLEEQFYLIWPLMLYLCAKALPENWSLKWRFRGLIALMSAFSLGATLWAQSLGMVSETFFLVHFRAWEFGVGAWLATISLDAKNLKSSFFLANFLGILGLLAIALPVTLFDSSILFPGVTALPSVLGTLFLIMAGSIKEKNYASTILANPFFVHVGKISYSMFLWHWALLAFGTLYYLERPQEWPVKLAILFMSVVMAELSYFFIEQPFRKKIYFKHATNRQVITTGLILSVSLAFIAGWIKERETHFMDSRMQFYSMVKERSSLVQECFDKKENIGSVKCTRRSAKADKDSVLPRIVFWGDSHVHARFPMMESFADTHMIEYTSYSFSSTPPLLGPFREEFKEQETYSQRVFEDIKKRALDTSTPLSVILTCNWTQGFPNKIFLITKDSNICYWNEKLTRDECLDVFAKSLSQTLQALQQVGVHKVLVSLPPLEFKYDVVDCYLKYGRKCGTQEEIYLKSTGDIAQKIKEVAATFNNVKTLSFSRCQDGFCPQVLSLGGLDVPVVYDSNHPSAEISRLDAEALKDELDWVIRP